MGLNLKTIPIDSIVTAVYNPRIDLQPGDPEYEKIKKSIEEYGLVEPLVWNTRNSVLVGGHQRLKVLKDLGHTEVDVSVVDIENESKEKALNLALNRISGDWDKDKLGDVLSDLHAQGFDLSITGFTEPELSKHVEALQKNLDEFGKVGADIKTDHTCPKCGYEFSGNS